MERIMMNNAEFGYYNNTAAALRALESIVDEATAAHCDNYCYYDEADLREAIAEAIAENAAEHVAKLQALLDNFEGAGWYNVADYAPGHADCLYLCGQRRAELYGDSYEILNED